ncbi:proline utilization protein [Diplodia corticola]|uniref:Proline utilization protein n=1 Tax=Diplodia corticola TaxID=236234 RepID=A0A1J9R0G0_9PEZI|nr:proline utilization protein [Diplodia corticola]OJD34112.1 proline utilization protein [Diplodia corticola]
MLVLTGPELSTILCTLTPPHAHALLSALAAALAAFTRENQQREHGDPTAPPAAIHQPQRTAIVTQPARDTTLIMPVSDTATATVVKVVTLPNGGSVKGSLSVFAPDGELRGVLNAAEVTAFRTALATMTLLVRWPHPVRRVVVFGAGRQVEWHVRLALKLLPQGQLARVSVFNRGKARLAELDKAVLGELRKAYPDVDFETVAREGAEDVYGETMRSRLGEADAVFCCTPSTEPLFKKNDLLGGTERPRFMSLIGSYKPEMQEIDTETLRAAARIWVDAKEECLIESGELIRAGTKPEELTEVGDLFLKGAEARVEEQGLTLFKCVGFGLMDLVMGDKLLELAAQLGKGVTVDGF